MNARKKGRGIGCSRGREHSEARSLLLHLRDDERLGIFPDDVAEHERRELDHVLFLDREGSITSSNPVAFLFFETLNYPTTA